MSWLMALVVSMSIVAVRPATMKAMIARIADATSEIMTSDIVLLSSVL
jgi:hypothetical protein